MVTRRSNAIAIRAIGFYQSHISQYKGYTCAHLVLNGGTSCSEAVKQIVIESGLSEGWAKIKERFEECQKAAKMMSQMSERTEGVSEERWAELNKKHGCLSELNPCRSGGRDDGPGYNACISFGS